MRIEPRFAAAPAAPAPRPREAGSRRFSLAEDGPAKSPAARASAPLATLDAILALQSEEDPGQRRRRSAENGRSMLDALDGLKAALLGAAVTPDALSGIAAKLADLGPSGDPRLDGILAEIDLRAKVELAKLGRADLT